MRKILFTGCLGLTAGTAALAHEGHGVPGEGHTVKHYLLEHLYMPINWVMLVVAIIIVIGIRRYSKRAKHLLPT